MNPWYSTYKALTSALFLTAFPPFLLYSHMSGRYRSGLRERLGFVPTDRRHHAADSPRVWIHAVSLGEVKVADAVVRALKPLIPRSRIIISTTTEHGRDLARETFPEETVIFAPLDVFFCVRTALSRIRPDIIVFLETEIWPGWIHEAHGFGARIAMINGRVSPRSVGAYLKLRPFFRRVLKRVDAFSMIKEEDGVRIRAMGADPDRIVINGNAKYDTLSAQIDPAAENEMRLSLDIPPNCKVLVAGSTRGGEEEMILDAYEKLRKHFPGMLLFIAPRHIERTPAIETLIKSRGLACQLRSDMKERGEERQAPVVIMNTFGELFKLYSVGTINFCGASLVPLGGQNPMEPAAWGKAAFYGPSMDDFVDARNLLESVDGGVRVSSSEDLAEKALWFLNHPERLEDCGKAARQAVMHHRQSAQKHARVIADLI